MSDSIYCRSALIYANFRIRWKVSWLIWSVLVMWTSLFACCALFHNTRLVMWSAYMVFFLSFLFVFVTFGGFVRFIWKFNKHPTNLHTHTHTYTYKNSIRMILLNQCILRLLTNYVRNFFLLFVACSGFLLSCFKNSKRTSVRSIFFFWSTI